MLKCTKCGESKEANVSNFPPHNKKRNGLDSWCRACRATYRSGIRRGNYRKFGASDDQIKLLLARGKCDICGSPGPRLCIDHCHATSKVRGVLCMNCNQALGKFQDNPDLLGKAKEYLEAQYG